MKVWMWGEGKKILVKKKRLQICTKQAPHTCQLQKNEVSVEPEINVRSGNCFIIWTWLKDGDMIESEPRNFNW